MTRGIGFLLPFIWIMILILDGNLQQMYLLVGKVLSWPLSVVVCKRTIIEIQYFSQND